MSAAALDLKQFIRDIPDFPKAGILFRDITPLLASPAAFRETVRRMAEPYRGKKIDAIVAAEARGFIFAAPLALELKAGPVVSMPEAGLLLQGELGTTQGGRGSRATRAETTIERCHELGGGRVVHRPQAGQYTRRPRVHERPGHADQPFATDLLAEGRAAAAQHDEVGGEIQVHDVAGGQEAVLRPALAVEQRQHEPREIGMAAVEEAVRGEVNEPVVREVG